MPHPPERRPAWSGYLHDALFFDGAAELLDATLGFAAGALESGEHLVLACTDDHNALVAEALGPPDHTTVLARDEVYRRPSAAIERCRTLARQALADGAAGLRLLAEVPVGDGPTQQREWARFEAVSNHALAELPIWSTCVYDRRAASTFVRDHVLATHRSLRLDGRREPNSRYVAPDDLLARFADSAVLPVEASSPILELPRLGHDGLRHARERVRLALGDHVRTAFPAAIGSGRLDDALLAVHEVTDNAVRHGAPPVSIRIWASGPDVVCTVSDAGPGTADPFVGYVRQDDALGLWVTRQLCEELDLHHDGERFTARLHLTLAPGQAA